MNETNLAKWLNDELSGDALAAFKNTAEYAFYHRIAELSRSLQAPEFDTEKAWLDFRKKQKPAQGKVVRLNPHRWLRVAAAVAVIFTVSFLYLNSLDEKISTSLAERSQVLLPDASEVFLNADSEISYSEKHWDEQRMLSLKGEAFFKVAKGKKFTVATEDGSVSVLGTRFNVENRRDFFEVSCFEGLVRVTFEGQEIELSAGKSFLAMQGRTAQSEVRGSSRPSWLNNESSFKSIPLSFVLEEFRRQYNVQVETRNIDLTRLFTGTFSNTNMNLALQSISTPSQIKYTLEGNKVLFYAKDLTP